MTLPKTITVRESKRLAKFELINGLRRLHPRMGNDALAKAANCSKSTVTAALNGHTERQDSKKEREQRQKTKTPRKEAIKKRRARVKKFAKAVERAGRQRRRPRNPSCETIRQQLTKEEITASVSTVRRDLHAMGFKSMVRPIRTYFADSDTAEKRLALANDERFNTLEKCKRLIFSDEHYVSINDKSHRLMWVQNSVDRIVRERKDPRNAMKLMIWACVGFDYKSPMVIWTGLIRKNKKPRDDDDEKPKGINARNYKMKCLSPLRNVLRQRNVIFQQDGAKCHTAKEVKNYMANQGINYIEKWPPYSPDLNMIEFVWKDLDQLLSTKFRVAETFEELAENVKEAWEMLDQQKINNHVLRFHSQLQKVRAGEL